MNVFWDTNLFVYLFEDYGALSDATVALGRRMEARGDRLFTSALTAGELLVKPRSQSEDRAANYERRLRRLASITAFDLPAARHFASIRQVEDLAAPDAIQLACAASADCGLFVTNDLRLSRKLVPGIPILSSLAQVPI